VAKSELEYHDQQYARLLDEAHDSLRVGDVFDAISSAVAAWDHVDGMMSYRRKYEKEEFRSVDCFDLVLSIAPLVFESAALEEAASILKSKKSVERHTSDDMGDRLSDAWELLRRAHRLWGHVAGRDWTGQAQLRSELGGSQEEWRRILDRWVDMGIVERRGEGLGIQIRLATDPDRSVKGVCHSCGGKVQAKRHDLLQPAACPRCGKVSEFTVTGELSTIGTLRS